MEAKNGQPRIRIEATPQKKGKGMHNDRSLFDMGAGIKDSEESQQRPMAVQDEQQGEQHEEASSGGGATGTQLMQLLVAQEYRCALSGIELTVDTVTVDHIVAVSDGGGDEIENIQLVHTIVNSMKGTLSNYEFKKWCARVGQWNG